MKDVQLITLLWWPHSGGRWLSRSILAKNSKIEQTTFVHPWIFNNSDDTLALDITAQVHKARSLPELSLNLNALKLSTDFGRIEGLRKYYSLMSKSLESKNKTILLGESCMGSPNPKSADLNAILKAIPSMKFIHLVRSPIESYNSFKNRHEMEGDPIKIAGSWVTLNAMVREYFNRAGATYKSQYLVVKYENLIDNLEDEMHRVCDFCGIDKEDNMFLNINERWGKATSQEVDKYDRELILSIARNEMEKYGYL